MALRKEEEGTDLREWYRLFIEIGLTLALVLLVVAFQFNYQPEQSFKVDLKEQEVVKMREVTQTKQQKEPPPPPKPPVPVEVPNNQTVENEDVSFDSSLDLDESLDTSQGPPPSDTGGKKKEEEEIFVVVEQQPDCGGVKALQKEVEYPDFARKAGIEGRVFVQFVVNENGKVTQPKVARGVHKLLNKEALRAVKQLNCEPGMQRGKPVKVRMSLPVMFRLQ